MKKTLNVMTCDRCGLVEEIRQEHAHYAWGQIWFAQSNGPTWVGSQDGKTKKDICPACIKAAMSWWGDSLRGASHG